MVVGGRSDQKGEDKGYVISLDDSVPVPTCLQSICDFPHYFYGATSGIFDDGLPTICGGRNPSPSTYYDSCYKFNFTNAWEPAGTMKTPSAYAGESRHGPLTQMCAPPTKALSPALLDASTLQLCRNSILLLSVSPGPPAASRLQPCRNAILLL